MEGNCFNTASGMDCMQCAQLNAKLMSSKGFNTASGMDCMQFLPDTVVYLGGIVSIPQAVWIACNVRHNGDKLCRIWFQYRKRYGLHAIHHLYNRSTQIYKFQYRKRYGLHAIPSLTALGTAEPRSGFSKRIALFGKSPQPRGIFLSPKSAENVRKPCNIKETFVHGKNLKLMALSPKSFPSL